MPPQKFVAKIVNANGHNFEVYEAGTGDKLALCLHGFPEHAIAYHNQVDTLVELGYRVWSLNQRGYGNSYAPDNVDEYKLDHLIEDVAQIYDASGASSLTLISHDWGGMVAWFFAIRKKRPIENLIVINIPHPGPFSKKLIGPQMIRSWYMLYFLIPGLAENSLSQGNGQRLRKLFKRTMKHPEKISDDEYNLYCANFATAEKARCPLNWYRANIPFELSRQIKIGLPKIETPTLLIWGEDDIALLKETTFGTDRYVKDLKIEYLPKVSHWPQQDEPAETNRAIRSFLTRDQGI